MSCPNCNEKNKGQQGIVYYRWKNANVAMMGCAEHLREIFDALNAYRRPSPPEPDKA